MKVKDMMHKGAEHVGPNAKLQTIAKKMRDHDIGAMLVCEHGKTVGMVTDRESPSERSPMARTLAQSRRTT